MKVPITTEVDEDFLAYSEDDEPPRRPMFCVTEQKLTLYYNDNNYHCISKSDPDTWRAETIDELYELMADIRIKHTLDGENRCRRNSQLRVDDFTVEFSNIFVEVEPYDETRLKTTTTYQNLGAARDAQREREKVEQERVRRISQEWEARRREEHDRKEFVRLSEKFKHEDPKTT